MRLKYVKTTISRGDAVIWQNFKDSPYEDKEVTFSKLFVDKNGKQVYPPKAEGVKYYTNLDTYKSKDVVYKVPTLQKGDIIESIFGRYKNFSAKTPMKEVGKALLVIPIFTSDMDTNDIKLAMESITEEQVKIWFKENIGESLVSKRKIFCNLNKIKKKYREEISENLDECA
jgi:hypothetical protein